MFADDDGNESGIGASEENAYPQHEEREAAVGNAMRCKVYGNVASKLLRTYTAQVEALAKLRRKGEQKVRVEHVHVHPGGQAIVGAVGTGGASDNQRQPHAKALSHAPVTPLWGEDEEREPVPLAGDAERQVPNARRRLSGSSER
jgi:hypothetical protein